MFTHRFSKFAGTAIVAAAFGLTALASAGTASAASVDDAFVDILASEGIVYASGDGQLVCDLLSAGKSPAAITSQVLNDTDLNTDQAIYLVAASLMTYCPQYENVPFS